MEVTPNIQNQKLFDFYEISIVENVLGWMKNAMNIQAKNPINIL